MAKYSLYAAARAYTCPVDEEHCPFEEPEGARPPLCVERVSIYADNRVNRTECRAYPVLPAESTAGNGTQPFVTLSNGLYLSIKEPTVVAGTVSAKPTTSSCPMTDLASIPAETGAAMIAWAARAMLRRTDRENIMYLYGKVVRKKLKTSRSRGSCTSKSEWLRLRGSEWLRLCEAWGDEPGLLMCVGCARPGYYVSR